MPSPAPAPTTVREAPWLNAPPLRVRRRRRLLDAVPLVVTAMKTTTLPWTTGPDPATDVRRIASWVKKAMKADAKRKESAASMAEAAMEAALGSKAPKWAGANHLGGGNAKEMKRKQQQQQHQHLPKPPKPPSLPPQNKRPPQPIPPALVNKQHSTTAAPTPVPTPRPTPSPMSYVKLPAGCTASQWGRWTSCTRPCGGGLRKRTRVVHFTPPLEGSRASATPHAAKACKEVARFDFKPCDGQP